MTSVTTTPTETQDRRTKRLAMAATLDARAFDLQSQIRTEAHAFKPIGIASEFSLVMGARPKRGVLVSLPTGGTYVFAKARCPSAADSERWQKLYDEAKVLDAEAIDLGFSIIAPGRTIGNRRVMSRGIALRDRDLLDDEELAFLAKLEAFWVTQGDDDKRVIGVVGDDGEIRVHAPWS